MKNYINWEILKCGSGKKHDSTHVYLYLSANEGSDQIRSIVATAHTLENHELENLEKLNCNFVSMQCVFIFLILYAFFSPSSPICTIWFSCCARFVSARFPNEFDLRGKPDKPKALMAPLNFISHPINAICLCVALQFVLVCACVLWAFLFLIIFHFAFSFFFFFVVSCSFCTVHSVVIVLEQRPMPLPRMPQMHYYYNFQLIPRCILFSGSLTLAWGCVIVL